MSAFPPSLNSLPEWAKRRIERSESERVTLQSRLAAAEAECRAREDVQARLIRERNAAEAEAEMARGLLREVRESVRHRDGSTCDLSWSLVARIDAHLASRPEGEALSRDGLRTLARSPHLAPDGVRVVVQDSIPSMTMAVGPDLFVLLRRVWDEESKGREVLDG